MTPELSQRLESILAFLESSVKTGAEFAADQAPDVVNQLLAWNFMISLIWFSVGAFVFVACVIAAAVTFWRVSKEVDFVFGAMTSLIPIAFSTIGILIISENLEWLQIWIAPKLYLLEYAASFLSK